MWTRISIGCAGDYVGDSAETIALLWDYARRVDAETGEVGGLHGTIGGNRPPLPSLDELVQTLRAVSKKELEALVPQWLDAATPTERWAMLKFILGNLRVGVSARLAKQVMSQLGGQDINDIENVWHSLKPPYGKLFDWLEGRADKPDVSGVPVFHPVMLSHPVEDLWEGLDPAQYQAEWKWDGIRVQLVAVGGAHALYTRTGDDISAFLSRPFGRHGFRCGAGW